MATVSTTEQPAQMRLSAQAAGVQQLAVKVNLQKTNGLQRNGEAPLQSNATLYFCSHCCSRTYGYSHLCVSENVTGPVLASGKKTRIPLIPYILESNLHPFYSFRGLKNQMRIRIACGLDSRS